MKLPPNTISYVIEAYKEDEPDPWVDVFVATNYFQALLMKRRLLRRDDLWLYGSRRKDRNVRIVAARASRLFDDIIEWNLHLVFMQEYLATPYSDGPNSSSK